MAVISLMTWTLLATHVPDSINDGKWRGQRDSEQANPVAASQDAAASHFVGTWLRNVQSQLWECVAGGKHADCSYNLGSFL